MPSAAGQTPTSPPHQQPPPSRNPAAAVNEHAASGSSFALRSGHWTESEKLRYLMFIEYHGAKLRERESRRLWKIFKHMAAFVGSRRPNQCRSHHKKMEAYFQTVPRIVAFYRQRYPHYQELFQQRQGELEAVDFGVEVRGVQEEIEGQQGSEMEERGREGEMRKISLGRANSIVLENEADGNEPKDLPKTDETIPAPSEPKQERVLRPSFIFPNSAEEYVHYPPYQMGSMQMPHFTPLAANSFFEYYSSQARSHAEGEEWRECHSMFLEWQRKLSQLMGRPE